VPSDASLGVATPVAIAGTCHSFGFAKYASRDPDEYRHRFNLRFNLSTILQLIG
jgi:hypothetical protein